MKIVQVIPALTRGGGERVVIDLANELVLAGHEVCILTGVPVNVELLPVPISPAVQFKSVLPAGRRYRAAYPVLVAWMLLHLRWLLSRDIVHCHLSFGAVFGSLLRGLRRTAGRSSPKVIETYHAVGSAIPIRNRSIHRRLLADRDAVALMARDEYWDRFIACHPNMVTVVIPNGVSAHASRDSERSGRYRDALRIAPGALVVGTVGRLAPERRPVLMLEAFHLLRQATGRDVDLVLAGTGPELGRIMDAVREKGLDGVVHLPGLVTDVSEPFGMIDLYLTTNLGEFTGIAALEAAMFGLPVIALQLDSHHEHGATEWIPSYTGLPELAAAAARLIDDDAARAELAEHQSEHAHRHHSAAGMAKSYIELYKRVQ